MKPKNVGKKLTLNKKTIANFSDGQLRKVVGGNPNTKPPTQCDCYSADTNCQTRPGIICTP